LLEERDSKTAGETWMPHFQGTTGVYGISSARGARFEADLNPNDQHLVFVDGGYLATNPSPGGNIRWDLVLREPQPPVHQAEDAATEDRLLAVAESTDDASKMRWLSALLPNQYSPASTLNILNQHKNVFHPTMGNLENIFSNSDRIIRGPLRQRVWGEDEIQRGNVVLIGDASRLLLPTSGQGNFNPP
jgi:2-polyprenyl-6-methoxyphenol hydroxylase-like FAD-dependent oxidoreductase